MKQQAVNEAKNLKIVIEEDEQVGYYLLAYDLSTDKCVYDNLYSHDQLDDLYREAESKYGIRKEMFTPSK